jgi:asparagine synthetase B (glutamine-hydrolysing)
MLTGLNGSFSLVIFNPKANQTVGITDRIASRALWYSREGRTGYFSNFPSAAAILRDDVHLDGAGLWALLGTSRPIAGHSLFYETRSLQAGQIGCFDRTGKKSIGDWYELRYKPEKDVSPREWGERIAHGLKESAGRVLKYSAPPYLFLSGGLDSRIAAGAFGGSIKSLTLTTHANMNSRIAENVARRSGIQHQTITRDPYYYLDSFAAAALVGSGNYSISHAHFIKAIITITRKDSPASFLLGDLLENFNGHYFKPAALNGFSHMNIPVEELPAIFNKLYSYSYKDFNQIEGLINPGFASQCRRNWSDELIALAQRVRSVSGRQEDVLDALFRWYNNNFCPTNLMLDCMKPFAEVRNLMFDNSMIDLLLRVPAELKTRGLLHRRILKALDSGLLFIANSNFWLPPIVPDGMNRLASKIRPVLGKARRRLIRMGKRKTGPIVKTEGSWHMAHEWYRKDSKYKDFIQRILFDDNAIPGEILDKKAIETHWREFQAGDLSKTFMVDTLLALGLLLQRIPARGIKFY